MTDSPNETIRHQRSIWKSRDQKFQQKAKEKSPGLTVDEAFADEDLVVDNPPDENPSNANSEVDNG